MTLNEAKLKAMQESALHQCGQHVNFKVTGLEGESVTGYFYVSDWYDSDSTVLTYSNGKAQ